MMKIDEIKISKTNHSKINDVDFDNIKFGHQFSDHMLSMDFDGSEWTNKEIVPYADFTISPANLAIHYGQSIFEGLKAYRLKDGTINLFRAKDNLDRLNKSARRMCMAEIDPDLAISSLKTLLDVDREWIPQKDGSSLYIRPFMFATDPTLGVKASETYKYLVITGPVNAYYAAPVSVKIESHYTRAVRGGVGSAKTAGNYAASLLPAKEAAAQGFDQIVWTDGQTHEYIEESGTMNIGFIINDTLITPALSDSILPGITRDSVLTVARDWGMKVEERKVKITEVRKAIENGTLKEAFGMGTAATIARIKSIGFEDKTINLPTFNNTDFSVRVMNYLDDIKYGRTEDKFGWIENI